MQENTSTANSQKNNNKKKIVLFILLLLLLLLAYIYCSRQSTAPVSVSIPTAPLKPQAEKTIQVIQNERTTSSTLQKLSITHTYYHCKKKLCMYQIDIQNPNNTSIVKNATLYALSNQSPPALKNNEEALAKKEISIQLAANEEQKYTGAVTVTEIPGSVKLVFTN